MGNDIRGQYTGYNSSQYRKTINILEDSVGTAHSTWLTIPIYWDSIISIVSCLRRQASILLSWCVGMLNMDTRLRRGDFDKIAEAASIR